jgi:Fe-S-cluster-containing hydrogenase component 2/bacterioferritin-associated ferredoxin
MRDHDPLDGVRRTGVAGPTEYETAMPGPERLRRGPVAVIECFERIPCDPCATACAKGAIAPFDDISDLPRIDHELCDGCGLCVVRCPGLAIFVVDLTAEDGTAVIKLPYEYLPLPAAGQSVRAVNRGGRDVCEAHVLRVQRPSAFDRTALVSIRIPASFVSEVRGVVVPPPDAHAQEATTQASHEAEDLAGEPPLAAVVCRCEEITEEDIAAAYAAGYRTPEEIKRKLRCGMGPCKGRTCMPLVFATVARLSGRPVSEVTPPFERPPLKPTPLAAFGRLKHEPGEDEKDDDGQRGSER